MRDDGRALAFGALALFAAAGLVRRGSRDEEQTFTRDGFPWPIETPAYHATAFADEILRQSFRTRQQGAPEMAGGAWTRSTSLTLSLPRAAAIALGLETLILGARGTMSCVELLDTLYAEVPEVFPEALVSGSNMQGIVWQSAGEGREATAEQAVGIVRKVAYKIDRGWHLVHAWDDAEHATLPRHAEQVGRTQWLIPPGTEGGKYPTDAKKCFFELYHDALTIGRYEKMRACFDPRFIGTRMDRLAQKKPGDVAVLGCRVRIPRVCTDIEGAVELGYVAKSLRKSYAWGEKFMEWSHDCESALRGGSSYDRDRKDKPLYNRSFWDREFPNSFMSEIGWELSDTGLREPETTVLYHAREEELIVFAPRRIQVVERLRMPYLRRIFGLGHRITFPWFDPKSTLESP